MKHIYHDKQAYYYACVRLDLVSLLPDNPAQKVLEIGASGGYTLCYLKENNLAADVTGVDLFDMPETQQNSPLIDRFIRANIESDALDLQPESFDVILCGDVLEHLNDPWTVVSKLVGLLKPGGTMIISVPNIREAKTLATIVFRADFRYDDHGTLDKTHLRFFCRKNAIELVTTPNLKPIAYHSSLDVRPAGGKKLLLKRIFNFATLGLFKDFLTIQHLIVCKKN